jgi:uncharacterized protein (DUF2164 family)
MNKNDREVGILSKEQRQKCVNEVVAYFLDERNEEIGIVAAENILDFVLDKIGPEIYNRVVDDSKRILQEQVESLGVELELLKRKE